MHEFPKLTGKCLLRMQSKVAKGQFLSNWKSFSSHRGQTWKLPSFIHSIVLVSFLPQKTPNIFKNYNTMITSKKPLRNRWAIWRCPKIVTSWQHGNKCRGLGQTVVIYQNLNLKKDWTHERISKEEIKGAVGWLSHRLLFLQTNLCL